jgi:hypothetical protein
MPGRLIQILSPVLIAVLACRPSADTGHASTSTSNQPSTPPADAPATAGGSAGAASASGTTGGVPPGYIGRLDNPSKSLSAVSYSAAGGGMWDVETGSHEQNLSHIMYSPTDTARGEYAVKTEIDQVSGPEHPEAAGVFIGGQDLAGPRQTYGYFLVRSDGTYSVKMRKGPIVTIVIPFKPSPRVPTADAAGRATYALTARVGADSVRFLVNEQPVAAVARNAIPVDGIAGIRINHGLHVMLKPLVISR